MSNDLGFLFKPIVLITGFGPFEKHPVNASWEAVKLMNKDEIEKKHNIELVQIEMPVTYENVDEFVPALWETHEPKLMIHVGVSSIAKCLTLESQAHKKGYKRKDYLEMCPANHICPADGAIRIQTMMNVEQICQEFNDMHDEDTSAVKSLDAGRYLCEYIYYTSLTVDRTRTIFVHVPEIHIYSSERTARALETILELCMKQLIHAESTESSEKNTLKVNDVCMDCNEDDDADDAI